MRFSHSLILLAVFFTASLIAEKPPLPPAAPIPPAIHQAKTVFISNRATIDYKTFSGGPYRIYDELYAALRAKDRFQIVDDPAKADLILELKSPAFSELVGGMNLSVVDPKTHVILWTLTSTGFLCGSRNICDRYLTNNVGHLVSNMLQVAQ